MGSGIKNLWTSITHAIFAYCERSDATQNASPAQDASFDASFVPIGVILPTIGSFEDGYTSVYSFNLVIDIIVTA